MAVQKEIWAKTIVEGLFADDSFAAKSMNDDAFVYEGKKVHIPNAGKPSKIQKNRADVPATATNRQDTDVEYDIDEFTTDPVNIPYADEVELSYNKRNSVIYQDRESLREAARQNLLYKWAPQASNIIETTGAAVKAHTPSATGNRKAMTKEEVKTLMTKFNKENIPQTDRYLLLDAEMYAQLLDSLTATDQIGFFRAADVKKGIIGELYGFSIMMRSEVLRYTTGGDVSEWSTTGEATDNAAALAWHKASVSRAVGEVKVFDSYNNPLYYGDVLSFLVRCGGAIRRKDKAGVWVVRQATAA